MCARHDGTQRVVSQEFPLYLHSRSEERIRHSVSTLHTVSPLLNHLDLPYADYLLVFPFRVGKYVGRIDHLSYIRSSGIYHNYKH